MIFILSSNPQTYYEIVDLYIYIYIYTGPCVCYLFNKYSLYYIHIHYTQLSMPKSIMTIYVCV